MSVTMDALRRLQVSLNHQKAELKKEQRELKDIETKLDRVRSTNNSQDRYRSATSNPNPSRTFTTGIQESEATLKKKVMNKKAEIEKIKAKCEAAEKEYNKAVEERRKEDSAKIKAVKDAAKSTKIGNLSDSNALSLLGGYIIEVNRGLIVYRRGKVFLLTTNAISKALEHGARDIENIKSAFMERDVSDYGDNGIKKLTGVDYYELKILEMSNYRIVSSKGDPHVFLNVKPKCQVG